MTKQCSSCGGFCGKKCERLNSVAGQKPPTVTVLPYMGKPAPSKTEQARKKYKSPRAIGLGVIRTYPRIKEDWQE